MRLIGARQQKISLFSQKTAWMALLLLVPIQLQPTGRKRSVTVVVQVQPAVL